jgi:hypothetical protein
MGQTVSFLLAYYNMMVGERAEGSSIMVGVQSRRSISSSAVLCTNWVRRLQLCVYVLQASRQKEAGDKRCHARLVREMHIF